MDLKHLDHRLWRANPIANPDSDANTNPYAQSNSDSRTNANTDTGSNIDTRSNTNLDPNANAKPNTNANTHSNSNSYALANTDTDANTTLRNIYQCFHHHHSGQRFGFPLSFRHHRLRFRRLNYQPNSQIERFDSLCHQ